MRRLWTIVVLLLAGAGAGAGFAASGDPGFGAANYVAIGYGPDRATGVALRSGLVLADSTSWATLTSTTTGIFWINGRANVSVSGHFTSPGATCTVHLLYEYGTGINAAGIPSAEKPYERSPGEVTLTATTETDLAGKYVSGPFVFDGAGATHCRVVLSGAPSAGSVDPWAASR